MLTDASAELSALHHTEVLGWIRAQGDPGDFAYGQPPPSTPRPRPYQVRVERDPGDWACLSGYARCRVCGQRHPWSISPTDLDPVATIKRHLQRLRRTYPPYNGIGLCPSCPDDFEILVPAAVAALAVKEG